MRYLIYGIKNWLVVFLLFGALGCAHHQSVDEFSKCGEKGPIKIKLSRYTGDDEKAGKYLVEVETAAYVNERKLSYIAFLTRGASYRSIINFQLEFQIKGDIAVASFLIDKTFGTSNSCIIAQYYPESSYNDGVGFSASLGN